MSKQLIFVLGTPLSGRTTWIKKNLSVDGVFNESIQCIDANNFSNLYPNSKISEESIELSRNWCLGEVRKLMEKETPVQKIVLCLIGCRPDRWRDFIQLAIDKDYEISFKFPSNKLLFYSTKHNSSQEQYKFLELNALSRYPRDKKEVKKNTSKNQLHHDEVVYKEINESTLFRYVVTEYESGYSFYLQNRMKLGLNKEEWLKVINEHYKSTISNDTKRLQKKAEREALDAEKAKIKAEKEARRLAREAEEVAYKKAKIEMDENLDDENLDDEKETESHEYMVDYVM